MNSTQTQFGPPSSALPLATLVGSLVCAGLTAIAQTNPPFQAGTLFIECEDYNFNSGQYISSATNGMNGPYNGWAYQNFVGTPGIDFQSGAVGTDDESGYRPADFANGVGVEGGESGGLLNDPVRTGSFSVAIDSTLGYLGTGGEWFNYTRVFNNSVYAPYLRASTANTVNVDLDQVVSDRTQSNQVFVKIGNFAHGNTGGFFSNYVSVPLQDVFGNPVVLRLAGVTTLRLSPFNYANINYIGLVPLSGVGTPPYVASVTPAPGAKAAQLHPPVNIALIDAGSGIKTNTLQLFLNGSNVIAGANITRTNNGYAITYEYGSSLKPLSTNTLLLIASDTNSPAAFVTNQWTFIAPAIYGPTTDFIECEDYNYGGGLFISDSTDGMNGPYGGWAYYQLTGVPEIDFHLNGKAGNADASGYRTNDYATGVGVQGGEPGSPMNDKSRGYFSVTNDSGVGYLAAGEWYNYTRVFSNASAYSVYMEAGTAYTINMELSRVTSDPTATGQTKGVFGSFHNPNLGNFYNFAQIPLQDAFGQPIQLWLSGTNTLRLTRGDYAIINYMAFVPVPGAAGAAPYIFSVAPTPGQVASQNRQPISIQLNDAGSGIGSNTIHLFLNGTEVTSASALTSTNGGMLVGYDYGASLLPGSTNTLELIEGDTNSPADFRTNTWTFQAAPVVQFPSNTAFVEAEDYNYNGGQFISDATDGMSGPYNGWAYSGFQGVAETDFHIVSPAGNSDPSGYRYNDFVFGGVGIQGGEAGSQLNDLTRSTFSVTQDSMMGYNTTGNWYNYTRTFSDGIYTIYLRMASGSASAPGMSVGLDLISGDTTTTNQTPSRLGLFTHSATTGFYDFVTVPLTNSTGGPVYVRLSGKTTFRLTIAHQYTAINYVAFVPVAPLPRLGISRIGASATMSWSNPVGWLKIQSATNLINSAWVNVVNGSNSPATVPITATNQFFRLAPLY